MNKDQKAAVVDEIAEQIGEAEAIFAVDYRGITVTQVADLRGRLREADARFRVVKNSLSERAADKAGVEDLKPMLVGPTALTLVRGDAALAAKALNDAARQFNLLEFKGGLLNGDVLSGDDVRSIGRLPSREVLYAQLVGTVAAPLTGLARTLNALISGLAIQLQAIADQELVSGEAPAAAAEPEPPAAVAAEPEAPAAVAAEPEAPAAVATEPEAPAAAVTEPEAPTAAVTEPEAPAAAATEPEAPAEPVTEPEAPAEPEATAAEPEAPSEAPAEAEAEIAAEPAAAATESDETQDRADADPSDA
ncbi:MAG: large subunit ribosomal protein [Solirubrobacteraceae bacterium]|jgi:large subunit ribosomal protein L10|nr:large subunit ribosomal protein [Solirubrobacteraceae bacterium]